MDKGSGAPLRGRAEEWRAVPDFEGLYEVSSFGRVRSFHGRGPRILVGGSNQDGYPIVNFYRAGKRVSKQLHQVVCLVFNGPPNILHNEVAHLDGNRRNARADNLKWVSKIENHSHKRAHGTHQSGERHPRAKLTTKGVEMIRSSALGHSALARQLGVSETAVRDVRSGRRWRS